MNLLADASVDIACPCTDVFDYACDLENLAEWFPGVITVVAHNDVPFCRRGREYRETVLLPLRGRRSVPIRVVDSEPPRSLATEGDLPLVHPRLEIHITECGADSCSVHWRMLSRSNNALVRFAVLPLVRAVMSRRASAGLHRLKERLEGRGAIP